MKFVTVNSQACDENRLLEIEVSLGLYFVSIDILLDPKFKVIDKAISVHSHRPKKKLPAPKLESKKAPLQLVASKKQEPLKLTGSIKIAS
jgi:hypothetical protein